MGIFQGQLKKAGRELESGENDLCGNRRGLMAETAFLLSKVGTTAAFWLNLQVINDLWLAKHSERLAAKLKLSHSLVAA